MLFDILDGGSVDNWVDLGNQVGSVIVVFLFLRAIPPIVTAVLSTMQEMKSRDLERIRLISETWERLYKMLHELHGDKK